MNHELIAAKLKEADRWREKSRLGLAWLGTSIAASFLGMVLWDSLVLAAFVVGTGAALYGWLYVFPGWEKVHRELDELIHP